MSPAHINIHSLSKLLFLSNCTAQCVLLFRGVRTLILGQWLANIGSLIYSHLLSPSDPGQFSDSVLGSWLNQSMKELHAAIELVNDGVQE